jgi:predicted transcriptional regulator
MSESGKPDGPPSFETVFDGEDVEQRIYGTILQTRDPRSASEIAAAVGCDPKTARKYLSWFTDLGIVTEYEGRPSTYERNDAYFEWRRVDELAAAHSREELRRRVTELTERIATYCDRYGAERPGAVDLLAFDESELERVHEDLGDWATAEHERRLCERARRQLARSAAETTG